MKLKLLITAAAEAVDGTGRVYLFRALLLLYFKSKGRSRGKVSGRVEIEDLCVEFVF
jgi:hypothetical protein